MKTGILAALLVFGTFCAAAEGKKAAGRPDFLVYHPDGSVKTKGVYQTDARGRVVKYTVFDGAGNLRYTEIPYYADDGRIVRADQFNAQGKLEKVIVFFDRFAKVLDGEGNIVETQSFSQQRFRESSK